MTLTDLDRSAVARSFDAAAANYDDHAVLQREVEDRLLERVPYFELEPTRILDLGCGTGRGSAALRALFPKAQVVSLDQSQAMLQASLRRSGPRNLADQPESAMVRADMHGLPFAPRRFDLVFSSLTVQWSAQEPDLFREILRVLRPGGLFLFSSLGPGTLQELRSAWASVDGAPHVNDYVDLQQLGDALVAAGFSDPVMDMETIVLEYREVLALMKDLKGIGATNAALARRQGLTSPKTLRAVIRAYEAFRQGERYPASYEVLYGATFGPPEGQPQRVPGGEIATFSVESLRSSRRSP